MPRTESELLWVLAYKTLNPKVSDASPNACLNRLVNERLAKGSSVEIKEGTWIIREENWPTSQLGILDRKHRQTNECDDLRPIIVVEVDGRNLLIDGNHRVSRWLSESSTEHRVLIISR